MATSDLNLEAQIRKLWEWDFFVTPHNFANGPHFVALTHTQVFWSILQDVRILLTHCNRIVHEI